MTTHYANSLRRKRRALVKYARANPGSVKPWMEIARPLVFGGRAITDAEIEVAFREMNRKSA